MDAASAVIYKSVQGYQTCMAGYDQALKDWTVPFESRYVSTRHGRTHVIICGSEDAPPLVIYHGWGGSSAGAKDEYNLPELGKTFRLYFVDTIGQPGRSAPNRPPTTGTAYGEWALDVLDGLSLAHVYMAGISGGGYLTLKTASFAPDRVIKALAISSAGLVSLVPPPLRFLIAAAPAMLFPNINNARRFVRGMSSPHVKLNQGHESMAQGLLLAFKHHRFQNGPKALTVDELQRITAPVYLLMGIDDVACNTLKSVERAKQYIPHIQTEIVPECGHVLTFDRPGLSEKRMLEFFRSKKLSG